MRETIADICCIGSQDKGPCCTSSLEGLPARLVFDGDAETRQLGHDGDTDVPGCNDLVQHLSARELHAHLVCSGSLTTANTLTQALFG